ncbi:hypothetical protein FZW96_08775 [Bacillus sp. BGMRC 2118]|nr:hypothetical protein FZW96_08775 [Bacillus sp. BGMRC 2118]
MIGLLIIGCEIFFWVFIIVGLITRYSLKKEKVGLFFLALTPLVDLVLLVATSVDLYNGSKATMAHGLAAVYIGVSIAFGKSMLQWADAKFQYYITKSGEKPQALHGIDFAKHTSKGWLRHVVAYLIGSSLLIVVQLFIQDNAKTEALISILKVWTFVLIIDFLISITYFIWPKQQK